MSDTTTEHWTGDVAPAIFDPDNEVTEGEVVDNPVYVVDAYTGDCYGTVFAQGLRDAYDAPDRGRFAPRTTMRDGKHAVLAVQREIFDRETGYTELIWYPVDVSRLEPGAFAGEYKFVHLTETL